LTPFQWLAAPIVVTDWNCDILFVNDAMCRQFGYKQSELKGSNATVFMPRDTATQHDKYIQEWNRTGRSHVLGLGGRHLSVVHKRGHHIHILLSVNVSIEHHIFVAVLMPKANLSTLPTVVDHVRPVPPAHCPRQTSSGSEQPPPPPPPPLSAAHSGRGRRMGMGTPMRSRVLQIVAQSAIE